MFIKLSKSFGYEVQGGWKVLLLLAAFLISKSACQGLLNGIPQLYPHPASLSRISVPLALPLQIPVFLLLLMLTIQQRAINFLFISRCP